MIKKLDKLNVLIAQLVRKLEVFSTKPKDFFNSDLCNSCFVRKKSSKIKYITVIFIFID